MNTTIFEINKDNIDAKMIREAAALLKNGGLVAFPTETVYGLGGNAFSSETVEKIFLAKGRPGDNPLIVHIHSMGQLEILAENIPKEAIILAEKFWPGPLTMIFKAKKSIPLIVTGGMDTVGIRMPSDLVALELLKTADIPVAAPSANISGRPSPTKGEHVIEDLSGKIDGIIVSSQSVLGIESTVLDLTVTPALILRPGSVSLEEIKKYIPVEYDASFISEKPRSPGTKYRHYAPKCDLYIVKGSLDEKVKKIEKIILSTAKEEGEFQTGILITKEMYEKLVFPDQGNVKIRISGSVKFPEKITADFYKNLREFDGENTKVIYMEDIPEEVSGRAYQNRSEKASGGKYI